jgi:hypothetical protein
MMFIPLIIEYLTPVFCEPGSTLVLQLLSDKGGGGANYE